MTERKNEEITEKGKRKRDVKKIKGYDAWQNKKNLWDMSSNLHGPNQNFDFKPFIFLLKNNKD